ncbi:hypothetical protein EGW08_002608 [Elysia chlorotica]|uniref:CARD domain-containing protein n=1 Tax=Elysia chlorotica TaxID=188477 RepID=A0A3S1BR75_ELYCH|nr:hypothetical protein EGW08_002608 [Elysia chlorotica]
MFYPRTTALGGFQNVQKNPKTWGGMPSHVGLFKRVPQDRVQRLLELLPKRGPDAFDLFLKVLEESYPWLATLLASAPQIKPQQAAATSSGTKADGGHKHGTNRGQARISSPGLQGVDLVDGDIRKIVQAFVHRQFGQSKRISEKDKKSVERFVSDQIQRERTRFLSMLSSSPGTPCSDMGSTSDNVFQATEAGGPGSSSALAALRLQHRVRKTSLRIASALLGLLGWFNVQQQHYIGYIVDGPQDGRLTILCAATHETGRGYHDSCLSRSHYTDTDPTSRERNSQDSNSGPFASEANVLPLATPTTAPSPQEGLN